MEELRTPKMIELLKRGLEIAYATSKENRVEEGTFSDIVGIHVYEGNTYAVHWINDNRMNKGIPYIQALFHYGESYWDNWTHHLSKSLDFSIFEV